MGRIDRQMQPTHPMTDMNKPPEQVTIRVEWHEEQAVEIPLQTRPMTEFTPLTPPLQALGAAAVAPIRRITG